jgi:hypothetical protein
MYLKQGRNKCVRNLSYVILILLFYLCTVSIQWLYENNDNSLNNTHEGETIIATQF